MLSCKRGEREREPFTWSLIVDHEEEAGMQSPIRTWHHEAGKTGDDERVQPKSTSYRWPLESRSEIDACRGRRERKEKMRTHTLSAVKRA